MANLCSLSDAYIQKKIHTGEWIPSLDTGQVYSNMKKDFLEPAKNKDGYLSAGPYQISHIIWVAANGPVPYGMEIDHINGNKQDNRLCNLQLVSSSENKQLSRAKVTFAQAEEIRRRYAAGGISQEKLAKEYHISKTTVREIINNRTCTKPVSTAAVPQEIRQEILSAYKNGRSIDAIRGRLKMQQAVVRQVLEEELNKEAEERKKQEKNV